MVKSKRLFENGQGIVEYILVTALVALAATAVFRTFRTDLQKAYEKAGDALVAGVESGVSAGPGE